MTPPIKITLVVDNEAPPELVAEHGFAAWIEQPPSWKNTHAPRENASLYLALRPPPC